MTIIKGLGQVPKILTHHCALRAFPQSANGPTCSSLLGLIRCFFVHKISPRYAGRSFILAYSSYTALLNPPPWTLTLILIFPAVSPRMTSMQKIISLWLLGARILNLQTKMSSGRQHLYSRLFGLRGNSIFVSPYVSHEWV